jgi:hypothetical protein
MQDEILEERCVKPGKRHDTPFAAIIGEPVEMQIDFEQGSGRQHERPLGLIALDDKGCWIYGW